MPSACFTVFLKGCQDIYRDEFKRSTCYLPTTCLLLAYYSPPCSTYLPTNPATSTKLPRYYCTMW